VKYLAILFAGIICGSTAIIWMKISEVDYGLLAAYRSLFAALILLPLAIRDFRRSAVNPLPYIRRAALPGLFLGLHFVTWIYGARLTLAANASLIANMMPLAMPFFLYAIVREVINRRELLGTVIAAAGLWHLAADSASLDSAYIRGDATCFISMIFVTGYLALGRANRDFPSIWTYLVPLYATAGIFALITALPRITTLSAVSSLPREIALIAALALIPTVFGHGMINFAMHKIRGQIVAVCALTQFIFSTILAYLTPSLREIPSPAFYGAAVLISIGVIVTIIKPAAKTE
jgi:drug/metabolite transporter (DMT)-like permease